MPNRVPLVWIIEDEHHQVDFIERLLRTAFGHCTFEVFPDGGSVVAAISTPGEPSVDLIVLDLLIPAGSFRTQALLPGLDLLKELRGKLGDAIGIIVRTGFEEQVPKDLITGHTAIIPKGRSPQLLLDVASAFLALRGHEVRQSVQTLASGRPIGAGPEWLSPVVVGVGAAVAASAWTAAVLAVVSDGSLLRNRVSISVAILGGAALGMSRLMNGKGRIAVGAIAIALVLIAGIVIPFS
jgi:DNA-binding NarL/FixJ family response regulator